jgi:hypothetical protein
VKTLVIVLLIGLAGCAHRPGVPTTRDEIVRDDVERARRYMNEIPGCSSEEGAVPIAELADQATLPPRVRGFLVRDDGICTLMACTQECCNKCRGDWKLSASRSGEAPVLVLDPARTWQAMDCSLRGVKAATPPLEVIVTGTVRLHPPDSASGTLPGQGAAGEIAYTSICGAR